MKRLCKNCANFYDRKEKECPYCGTPASSNFNDIKKMSAEKKRKNKERVVSDNIDVEQKSLDEVQNNNKVDIAKLEKLAEQSTAIIEVKKTEEEDIPNMSESERDKIKFIPKHKRKRMVALEEDIKIDGIHIDVSKASMFEKKLPKRNKFEAKGEYSAKKSRGDYALEKLKWWEIYRWADRMLVRRKIKKVVNREAIKKPDNINYFTLLLLCIFTGYLGIHNIYAKNLGKGWTMFGLFCLSFGVVALSLKIPFFAQIQVSIGGLSGMIVLVMWTWDLISIIFKKFIYKTSKLKYIKSLDVETRARLGKKYI